MSEAIQVNGQWTCAGFTEGDVVSVGGLGRGTLIAILGRSTNHPYARVNFDRSSWEGGFDSLAHADEALK